MDSGAIIDHGRGAVIPIFCEAAVKTVEGASNTKCLTNLQQLLGEQIRKQAAEK